MEEHKSCKKSVLFYYCPIWIASLGPFTCGTLLGWTSPLIPKLNGQIDAEENPLLEPLTMQQETWLGSLLPLGATFGAIFAGLLANKIGIKQTFVYSMILLVLAFPVVFFAASVEMFYIFRFLCGLSVGGVFTALSIFVGQIEDDKDRKRFGVLIHLFVNIGILFSYVVGFLEIQIPLFNLMCSVAPILFIILATLYIIGNSYHFAATYDDNMPINIKNIPHKELDNILIESSMGKGNIFEIFKSKDSIKALIISIILVSVQQFSGIYVILFYTDTIFRESKVSILNPSYSTITIGMVLITANLYTLINENKDKLKYFAASAVCMGISHGLLSYYFYLLNYQNIMDLFVLPTFSLIMYIVFFSIEFGQLTWTFVGELFPRNVRSMGIAITNSCGWLFAFIATKSFFCLGETVVMEIYFLILMIVCFLGAILINFIDIPRNGKSVHNNYGILHEEKF